MVIRGVEPAISPKSGLKHTITPNSPPSPPALFCWSRFYATYLLSFLNILSTLALLPGSCVTFITVLLMAPMVQAAPCP
eukprot:2001731-Prymnesium_polylepis.1